MPADCNVIDVRGDKSYVYDLAVQRGIVSSRVALLLRSAEVKPLLSDLLLFFLFHFFWPGNLGSRERGGQEAGSRKPWGGATCASVWNVVFKLWHTVALSGSRVVNTKGEGAIQGVQVSVATGRCQYRSEGVKRLGCLGVQNFNTLPSTFF